MSFLPSSEAGWPEFVTEVSRAANEIAERERGVQLQLQQVKQQLEHEKQQNQHLQEMQQLHAQELQHLKDASQRKDQLLKDAVEHQEQTRKQLDNLRQRVAAAQDELDRYKWQQIGSGASGKEEVMEDPEEDDDDDDTSEDDSKAMVLYKGGEGSNDQPSTIVPASTSRVLPPLDPRGGRHAKKRRDIRERALQNPNDPVLAERAAAIEARIENKKASNKRRKQKKAAARKENRAAGQSTA